MKREKWDALDGLRGVSILFVVLVHLWAHSNGTGNGFPIKLALGDRLVDITWIFATASNAVKTFFVLSGFLLYRHWIEQESRAFTEHVLDFYKKRLRRIFPAFTFFTAIYLALTLVLGKHHFGADLASGNILFNLSFTSPLASLLGVASVQSLDIVPGTWSLNAEMWFYLLMPVLALALRRAPISWVILLVLSLAAPVYRQMLGADPSFIARFSLPGVGDAFLVGMAIGGLSAAQKIPKIAGLLFPIGAVWYFAVCASATPIRFDDAYQVSFSSALMVAGLVAPGNWPWKRWLSGGAITQIGRISFSMFLCNVLVTWYVTLPISEAAGIESSAGIFAMNLLLGYPVIYLISWASYRFVEAPFLAPEFKGISWVARPALLIAGIVASISIASSASAYVLRGGIGVEYTSAPLKVINRVVRSSMPTEGLQLIPLIGKATVDSETNRAPISLQQLTSQDIRIASHGSLSGNRWVAVMLPVDPKFVARGRPIYLKATLSVIRGSDTETCLGIYNGKADVCSRRVKLAGPEKLSIETSANVDGPLQFKLNIFPSADDKPFDIEIKDVMVLQDRL